MDYVRYDHYESVADFQLLNRLPVIIKVSGRSFSRLTRNLDRPFDKRLINVFKNTLLHTIQSIDDAVFGFQYSDELVFVLRNDRSFEYQPYHQNKIQEILGIIASTVTVNFFKNLILEDELNELDGDAIFRSKVFTLPSINETVNFLIYKQQLCMGNAIFRAAQAEITNLYGKSATFKILNGKKLGEKLDILQDKCQIDYESHYPAAYRNGIAAYKVPKIIKTSDGEQNQKNKWIIDSNLPIFSSDKNFLINIINSGSDVFRIDRDLMI